MSVAFRRESDEEHKEPRFEIPLPPGPNFVTPSGMQQAETRVSELEALVMTETEALRLEQANPDLRYWRTRLATAELAPQPPDEVAFGSRVTFRLRGAERAVDIVGDDEADPAARRIAFSALLAGALIGAAVGDSAKFGGDPGAIEIMEIGRLY